MSHAEALPDLRADARRVAELAVREDGPRDITTEAAVRPGLRAVGRIEFRDGGVLAGVPYGDAVLAVCGMESARWAAAEGEVVPPGATVGEMEGDLSALLRAERPMLNLLQRASGIATATRAFVDAVAGTPCRILHTRKTAPGLRGLDLRAVLAGGGAPHRVGLADTVLVKDNHWQALAAQGRTLAEVLNAARAGGVVACYVEVETAEQVRDACSAGASRLLVDNQPPETLRAWASLARGSGRPVEIEATGGITLANVRAYAEAGADYVSIGALTHSAPAADLALEVICRP